MSRVKEGKEKDTRNAVDDGNDDGDDDDGGWLRAVLIAVVLEVRMLVVDILGGEYSNVQWCSW